MNLKFLLVTVLIFTFANSLYDENSAVFKLTEQNFKDTVLMSDEFWLV